MNDNQQPERQLDKPAQPKPNRAERRGNTIHPRGKRGDYGPRERRQPR